MNEFLQSMLEAHGGVRRWNEFTTVKAQIVSGGGLWALKGLIQNPAPREMRAGGRGFESLPFHHGLQCFLASLVANPPAESAWEVQEPE
jgi:hypothetical protein